MVPQRGLRLLIRRSKTDQRGAGQAIALWANPKKPGLCPARALEAWLGFRQGASDHTGGASDAALPLFVGLSKAGRLAPAGLSDKAAWRLVKQAPRDAGLANPEDYFGHSLRAGLATAAGEAGADNDDALGFGRAPVETALRRVEHIGVDGRRDGRRLLVGRDAGRHRRESSRAVGHHVDMDEQLARTLLGR